MTIEHGISERFFELPSSKFAQIMKTASEDKRGFEGNDSKKIKKR